MTNNPFPGHHPRPVSVDILDGIEAVATAIQQLHEAMANVSPTHQVGSATSMCSDQLADILRLVHEDERQFAAAEP